MRPAGFTDSLHRSLELTQVRACYSNTKSGLGDSLAMGLAAFGITKERVAWVRGLFGSEPGCGGCPERQEALNELGKKIGL
jgi:hypothetical protein